MTDLPFQAEYAKTGRAACKGCKQKIDQGALRIAIMVQSAFFDGKQPNWHHEDCFFKKQRPNSASDIGNFNKLKTVDQKRIKSTMENSTGIVMPVAKPKGKGKSKKRAADDGNSDAIAESTNLALKDYLVEYSKSSRATCKHCDIKIVKDEVRISKTVYDTEVGSKYGGQPLWHHVKCFAERRSEFNFFAGGESLPGFNTLNKEDKAMVKEEIKPFKADEVPVKKLKVEPKNEEELKEERDKEKKLDKQNKLYFKYRGALKELSKANLEELLEVNSQQIPVGKDECLDRLADCMAFGILEPCTECKNGQLVLDTFGYKCTGNLTEWTKCSHVTQNPKRAPMTVPNAFKDGSIFKRYKPKTDVRLFESERIPLLVVVKNEATDTSVSGDSDADVGPSPNCVSIGSHIPHNEGRLVIGEVFSLRQTDSKDSRASIISHNHPPPTDQKMQETPWLPPASQIEITISGSRADPAIVTPPPIEQQETARKNSRRKPRRSFDVHQDLAQHYLAIAQSNAESMRILAEATKMHAEASRKQAEASLLFTHVKKEMPVPPLKNLQFFLYGKLKSKEETKKRILKLGGLVVSKLAATCVAVVSTKKDVERMPDKMEEIKSMDIEVVEESFLDLIEQDGTISKSLELIKENNIADWGSDPATRVPQDVLDGKSIPKSGSMYVKSSKSAVKLKIQGGTAVDPASNLQDEARVYTDYDGTKYTVVLSQTDVVAQKNSYYKLQVLESDGRKKYWLFRSWGRIGTTIGGSKVENCKSRDEAVKKFEEIYMERTENPWEHRDHFMKVPGRYFPLDMDYGTDDAGPQNLAVDAKCDLPVPVQKLIIRIFDVDVMKKTLLEFELDTEKMPLGKLSKKQIKSGYKILSELLKLIEKGSASQGKLIDATNRFFTLIPHDFGVKNAPLLDNMELIKTKTAMLDNLLEIEIAYSLMKSDTDEDNPISGHYLKLKANIAPLPMSSPEFEMIQEYVRNTHAATHSTFTLDIEQVFKVVREGEDKRFKPFKKLHNRRLLWHGSRVTNFAGIISQGLRIAPPEAPVTGYMFGKGVYFADMVSKSANYCCTNTTNRIGLMLLCEVALGNMKECHQAENVQLPPNMHSAWGVGRTMPDPAQNRNLDDGTIVPLGKPVANKVNTHLLYNEFIVYDVAQVNVKYLLQMKFNHKY